MIFRKLAALAVALPVSLTLWLAAPTAYAAHPAGPDGVGAPGIGDGYFPLDGNGGIDVLSYRVADRWDFDTATLSGSTRIELRATEELSRFNLDFLLDVTSVRVDGRTAAHRKARGHELVITPARPLARDRRATVVVRYRDRPADHAYQGERSWLASGTEVVAMGEPHMAPWWFPANDHPLDKARYRFDITVRSGLQVIANGRPQGKTHKDGWTTHHWKADEPMASYLAFFAAGRYAVKRGTSGGLPWIIAASRDLGKSSTRDALAWLRKTPGIVAWLSSELGPYPFNTTGGLVTNLQPGFALENQTRPTYPFVGDSPWLLVHELAHQWFGDSVSVQGWRDIWLNEGFATYMEQLYAEVQGQDSGADWLRRQYDGLPASDGFWRTPVADPGAANIFAGSVYTRGAMTLMALRNVIGAPAMTTLLRTWVAQQRDGNATTADFTALAEQVTGRQLDGFFAAWLVSGTKPADTAANGLG